MIVANRLTPPRAVFVALMTTLFILLHGATSHAQTSKVGATLAGTVSDSSGGVIPGVQVRLRNTLTNRMRIVTTDEQGVFRAEELAVGTYEVSVEHPGFAPYRHVGVVVALGATVQLPIVLAPASASANVTVSAQPPPIDVSQISVVSTVDQERIEELPVRTRNYLGFALLAPGVSQAPQAPPTGGQTPLAGSGFTFGGLRARSNSVSIDGLDNNDEFTGSSRTELSPEIVSEFQVVNNGLSAESGGASGGSINVVTRSGTNTVRGDAFVFAQDSAFNARNPFEDQPGKPSFRRFRAGFALGGPIVRDRTFYYAAAEQEHNRGQNGSEIDPALAAAIGNFLSGGADARLATRQITTGFSPIARAETEAAGRLDHQFRSGISLMLRYTFTNNKEAGDAFNTGGLTDVSARGSSFTSDNTLSGSLVKVFGSEAVGDLRFQAATRHAVLRTNDAVGPQIDIAGLLSFGRPYGGNSARRENHYEVSYTYTASRGRHLWKAGATVNRVRLRASLPDGFGGVYLFRSLADFLASRPAQFRQAFGVPTVDFPVTSVGAFVQDHWSLMRKVTLNLGVRYDFERLPSLFNQDTNNFSPRIGLAWSPSQKWVLRAGYGIFFDRQVLANLSRAIERNGVNAFEQVADDDAAVNLFAASSGGPLLAPAPAIAPSIFRPAAGLATPYSQQASAGVEYLLAGNLTLSANYLFVRGVKLSHTANSNLLPPVVLTPANAASLGISNPDPQQLGRKVFPPSRNNPAFNDIYLLEDSTNSTYHGVSFTLNRRMANELEFSASYTLSKTFDDASDFDEQPENPFNLHAEGALARQHQQHRFVFNALWELPIGEEEGGRSGQESGPEQREAGRDRILSKIFGHIEASPIFTAESGRPVNPLVGLDENHSHAFPLSARPLGSGRNSLKSPAQLNLDFRVLKYFPFRRGARLDIVAEFFNLFNRANVTQINPFFGTNLTPQPGFLRAIEGRNARQIQFSLDYEF